MIKLTTLNGVIRFNRISIDTLEEFWSSMYHVQEDQDNQDDQDDQDD